MVSQRQHSTDEIASANIDVDRTAKTLADSRYREVLYSLVREGGSVELDELARTTLDADDEQAAVRLHHVVLPKLDDFGLLAYDPDAHSVELAHPVSRVRDSLL